LPVRTQPARVTTRELEPAGRLDRRVISAPVTLAIGGSRWHISRLKLARMLVLQQDGRDKLQLGGSVANAYFARLDHKLGRPPRNASFSVTGDGKVVVVPAEHGVGIDVPRTAAALVNAAKRVDNRVAQLAVAHLQPARTTADARAMGISGLVGSYETFYGGIANRIHNVQLVAHLIDGKLVAPGAAFSFNQATGARTAEKGFLEAPVIINGELQTGLGGGVCQVSTTTFNAAYEAGLPITSRTNHALYISHYPLGRDATVDYPNVDLKFVNDTPHWLLLRTFVGSSSLVVALYGAPQHRRVETETAPLRVVAEAPVIRQFDPSVAPGTTVVASSGVPAQATSVRRRVFAPNGKLLSDTTWSSSYRSEPEVLLFGPKKVVKPKPKPKPKPAAPTEEAPAQLPTPEAPSATLKPLQ
jgi:vancomycin resistance protein YoaR